MSKYVRIREAWAESPEEAKIVYEVVEDNSDRLIITPTTGFEHCEIKPTKLVYTYMVLQCDKEGRRI
jgi:hypothetical protein